MTNKKRMSISIPEDLYEELDKQVHNKSAHIAKLLKMDLYGERRFEKIWKEDKKADLMREASIQMSEAEALEESAERKMELADKLGEMETDAEREQRQLLEDALDVLTPREEEMNLMTPEQVADNVNPRLMKHWADKIGINEETLRDKLITHVQDWHER